MSYTIHPTDIDIQTAKLTSQILLKEYNEIMDGNRVQFSELPHQQPEAGKIAAEVLRSIFESQLQWTPQQVAEELTLDFIKEKHLSSLINLIYCPPELNRRKDLSFVAWFLYPDTAPDPYQLVGMMYRDLCDGKRSMYPFGYFIGSNGCMRAKALFQFMLDTVLPARFANAEQLYAFFADKRARSFLEKYHLGKPLDKFFSGSCVTYLHESIPNNRDDQLFKKYLAIEQGFSKQHVDVKTDPTPCKESDAVLHGYVAPDITEDLFDAEKVLEVIFG